MLPQEGEIWQHYKTKGEYEIIGLGKLQVKNETLDMVGCVFYKALSDGALWARPVSDFIEDVNDENGSIVGRFIKVSKNKTNA